MTSSEVLPILSRIEERLGKLENTNQPSKKKIVLVSGFFDFLNSGHIAFLNDAAKYGQLYVCIGTDKNHVNLRAKPTIFPEDERLFMVQNVKVVRSARLSSGKGMIDFEPDLKNIKPDILYVNEEGDVPDKRSLCQKYGISYIVGKENSRFSFQPRSSEIVKANMFRHYNVSSEKAKLVDNHHAFPWRICLAGGWLDQPWVSSVFPGPVIVVNIHPHQQFKTRSGLATSTRTVGMGLWGTTVGNKPPKNLPPEKLARYLFGAENPPDCGHVSGSQDHLGLMLPGINRLDFDGKYWPEKIVKLSDEKHARWLESVLWLVPLPSRPPGYNPLLIKNINLKNVKMLAESCHLAWDAICTYNAADLGKALSGTMQAWANLLPYTVPQPQSTQWCEPYKNDPNIHGYLFTGAGGGFLMVVSEKPVLNGFQIKINTDFFWDQTNISRL